MCLVSDDPWREPWARYVPRVDRLPSIPFKTPFPAFSGFSGHFRLFREFRGP